MLESVHHQVSAAPDIEGCPVEMLGQRESTFREVLTNDMCCSLLTRRWACPQSEPFGKPPHPRGTNRPANQLSISTVTLMSSLASTTSNKVFGTSQAGSADAHRIGLVLLEIGR